MKAFFILITLLLASKAYSAEYLVAFKNWSKRSLPQDVKIIKSYPLLQVVSVESLAKPTIIDSKFIVRRKKLLRSKNTDYLSASLLNGLERIQTSIPWNVSMVNAPQVWETGVSGQGVRVLVLDSGIDRDHPAFKNKIVVAKDFTGFDLNSYIPYPEFDLTGHGTHVAGTILANSENLKGVAPEAELYVAKVCIYICRNLDVMVDGLEWGLGKKVDVVNMSFSSGNFNSDLAGHIFERLETLNVVAVAAAGNEREKKGHKIRYPADQPTVLAVAAIDINGHAGYFSSKGLEVSLSAPGVDVLSADLTRNLKSNSSLITARSGTSMAAPHVTGVVALVKEAAPTLKASEVREVLKSTTSILNDSTDSVGNGLVDAFSAVKKARTLVKSTKY